VSREQPPAGSGRESIARNVGFSFVISVISAVFSTVLLIYLTRALGPEEFGVFALAMSIGTLVLLPSNLGIPNAAARFMAEQHHDRPAVRGVVFDALRLKLVISAVLCLVLAALAAPIADAYDTPELTWPIRIVSLAVFGQSIVQLYDQIFEAEGRMSVYLRIVTAESAVETFASIALVLAGLGVSGAMAGRAGAYLFAAGFGLVLVVRTLGMRGAPRDTGRHNVKRILGYGSALLIIDGAFTLFSRIDVLLIGAILDVTAVGEFEAATRALTLTAYVGAAVASGVSPRVAKSEEGPNTVAFERSLAGLMLLQGAFLAPLIVWAEPLTNLVFGDAYQETANVLRVLAPFAFLMAISPVLASAVNYLGEAKRRIPLAIGALLINVAIDLVLLPEIGVIAGAIGTSVAYTVYVAGHLWICRDLLGTRMAPLAKALGQSMLAAAVMCGVLFAFGTGSVALPLLIAGGIVGALVYGGVLVLVGAVTRAQAAALAARFLPSRGA
jgi:O-antigen/teichoic acid export membrane protein